MAISSEFAGHLKLAFAVTLFYFLATQVFEQWSQAIADKFRARKPIYYVLKIGSFFFMVLMTIAVLFELFGNQDLAQTFGLTKGLKRGKVIMRIPAPNNITTGIVLLEPHLYAKQGGYVLSFKFQIHKGLRDKQLDLVGGRFIIESMIDGKVVDQTELQLNDAFEIKDGDLSGVYVSPQPFPLKVKPDSIDLTWEMKAKDGDVLSSKPYLIRFQSPVR